jgi:hypothetical protein
MNAVREVFDRRPLWILVAMVVSGSLSAQTPRQIPLRPVATSHPEEFTSITSLREFSDGRVLVTDGREQRLLLLNFADGSAEVVGRRGGGPNEYGMIGLLHRLSGDSSIMSDLTQRRWLLFDGGRIVATIPNDNPAVRAAQESYFTSADGFGHVLSRVQPHRRDGRTETGSEDSTTVILIERATGRADTIARTQNAERVIEIQRDADGRIIRSSALPKTRLVEEEVAVLLTDGWLAVARVNPFRVEWRAPNGIWTRGPIPPIARIRIDARERDAFHSRNRPTAGAIAMPPGIELPTNFPEFIPVFAPGQVQPGPEGTVLIRRSRSADFPGNHYLVFDRVRGLLGEITLPLERAIVGVGVKGVYVTNRDSDDVLRLTLHPWP